MKKLSINLLDEAARSVRSALDAVESTEDIGALADAKHQGPGQDQRTD
jgi:hypothetical protein